MPILADVQKSAPGRLVTLYKMDAREIGGDVYYFTSTVTSVDQAPDPELNTTVSFGGIPYHPMPIAGTDFELTGKGSLPTPKLAMGTQLAAFVAAILGLDDIVGATVTRTRTFERYLDGQPGADASQKLLEDTFIISRMSSFNAISIEWEMKASIALDTGKLPRRPMTSGWCGFRYRLWDPATETFDYTGVACPYLGIVYFKQDGTPTDLAKEDRCGKQLGDCRLRFGGTVPFGGFPGLRE